MLADEATDISNKEQMSLVLPYLSDTNRIKEKFVSFIYAYTLRSGIDVPPLINFKTFHPGHSYSKKDFKIK